MRLCCTGSQTFLMTSTQQVWYSLYGWITSFAKAKLHLTGIQSRTCIPNITRYKSVALVYLYSKEIRVKMFLKWYQSCFFLTVYVIGEIILIIILLTLGIRVKLTCINKKRHFLTCG